jgi:peptide/nickel transport system permease protein
MTNYIIRRALLNVIVLWIVATLVFLGTHALPSDYATKRAASGFEQVDQTEAIRLAKKELGLDKPLWKQYTTFMTDLATGDLGQSYETRRSTWTELRERLPATLELGTATALLSFLIAIPVGVVSAVRQNTWADYVLRGFAILAVATPVFFIAILLSLLVLKYDLFTIDIVGSPHIWSQPGAAIKLYSIPVIAGGITGAGGTMRLLRSQMLEVMRQDYIRTARAKGLKDRAVYIKHALKNAMLPVLTVMGLTISGIVGGQVILEAMFDIDGVGRFLLRRLNERDFPPFQGTVFLISAVVVFMNLLVDICYAWLDPRIKYT